MKEMRTSTERAVDLTDYLFSLPGRKGVLIITILSCLIPAIAITLTGGMNILLTAIASIFFMFLFVGTISLLRKIKFEHILATYVLSNVVIAISFLLSNPLGNAAIPVGIGFMAGLWYIGSRLAFNMKYSSVFAALIFLVYTSAFLYLIDPVLSFNLFVYKVLVSFLVMLVGIFVIFWLVNAPMKRAFGVSGTTMVSYFMAQWFKGTKELESVFAKVGEKVESFVDVVLFKGKRRVKASFVVPHIHYGLFGNLGGSEFPVLIAQRLGKTKLAGNGGDSSVFVFHGTATHGFNPVRSEEVVKVVDAAQKAANNVKLGSNAHVIFGNEGECNVRGIAVEGPDRYAVCFLSRAPKTTEDIEFSAGLALNHHAEKFVDNAAIVDAHNAETGELEHVRSGSPLIFDYERAITEALKTRRKGGKVKLGIASTYPQLDTIEEAGIKVALFSFEDKGKKGERKRGEKEKGFAIILIDSNGITPGFRHRIIEMLHGQGIESEVCTTDTHAVNVVKGVLNPVGTAHTNWILKEIKSAVEKARENMEEVKVGVGSKNFKIDVLGPGNSRELIGIANSIVAVLRIAGPVIMVACLIAAYSIVRIL